MPTEIGPIPLPPTGTRASGTFTFEGDPGLERYAWPYFAIAGGVQGPTVLITAGIQPLGRITAPVGGVVLFIVTSPAIKKDGLLLAIGAL